MIVARPPSLLVSGRPSSDRTLLQFVHRNRSFLRKRRWLRAIRNDNDPAAATDGDRTKLMGRIKAFGLAGTVSYVVTELAFWSIALPGAWMGEPMLMSPHAHTFSVARSPLPQAITKRRASGSLFKPTLRSWSASLRRLLPEFDSWSPCGWASPSLWFRPCSGY